MEGVEVDRYPHILLPGFPLVSIKGFFRQSLISCYSLLRVIRNLDEIGGRGVGW